MFLACEAFRALRTRVRLVGGVPLDVSFQTFVVGEHVKANGTGIHTAAEVTLTMTHQIVVTLEGFSANL